MTDCNGVNLEVTHRDTTNNGTGCEWTYVRVYAFTDVCGNGPTLIEQTITVRDTTRPHIEGGLEPVTVYRLDDCGFNYPDTLTIADMQNSGMVIIDCNLDENNVGVSHSDISVVDNCISQVTRTYTISDECGNSNTFTQIINIEDTTRPAFNEEIPEQQLTGTNCVFEIPDFTDTVRARISDNCTATADITIEQLPLAGTTAEESQDVTITISDLCGNTNTTIIHVVVPDTLEITINHIDTAICQGASVTMQTTMAGGVAPYTYEWTPTTGLDVTDTESVTASPEAGEYQYVVTITDANGCVAHDTMNLTVDTLPAVPTLTMTANTICVGQQNGTITIENPVGTGYSYSLNGADYQDSTTIYTDLSTGEYYVTVLTAEGCYSEAGTITVENSQELPTIHITRVDTIVCPNAGEIMLEASITGGDEPFVCTWTGDAITATDSLNATLTIDPSNCNAAYFVELGVVDVNNCSSNDTMTVVVRDTVRPTITGTLETITYNGCTSNDAPAAVTTIEDLQGLGLTLNDNCTPVAALTLDSRDEISGNCPIVINRYYTVTDLCNNVSEEYLQVLQVYDSIAPVVDVNAITTELNDCDVTAAPQPAQNTDELDAIGFSFSDNCLANSELSVSIEADTTGHCPIIITRTYIVADSCGNSSAPMTHTITIFDSISPVIEGEIAEIVINGCDTTVLRSYPIASTAAELLSLGGISFTEACTADENLTVQSSETVYGECPIVVTRTYTVTDECGNVSNEVEQVIMIQDTTRPIFDEMISDSLLTSTNCEFVVPDFVAYVIGRIHDNCTLDDEILVEQSPLAGSNVDSQTEVFITIEDACGNTNTHMITIRIPEELTSSINQSDTAFCQGGSVTMTVIPDGGTAPFTYVWWPDDGLDAAEVATVTSAPTFPDTYSYTVQVTDANGCTSLSYINIDVWETPDAATTETSPNMVCTGTPNGSITITSPLGNQYLYSINGTDYQSEPLFENLADGDYQVTVQTDDGCLSPAVTATVGRAQDLPSVQLIMPATTICPNLGDQTITAEITGGEAPFTITWDGDTYEVVDSATITLLVSPGFCDTLYHISVDVMDINHCVTSDHDSIVVQDVDAPMVTGTIAVNNIEGCMGDFSEVPDAFETVYELADYVEIEDNCSALNQLQLLYSADTIGTCPTIITRYYNLVDQCGNVSDTVREVIIIDDNTRPLATPPYSIEMNVNDCDISSAPDPVTAASGLLDIGFHLSDNCTAIADLQVNVTERRTFAPCDIFIARTYTVTDACGNVSDEVYHNIHIIDRTAPRIDGTLSDTLIEGCDISALDEYPAATTGPQLLAIGGINIIEACTPIDSLIVASSYVYSGTCPIVVTRTYTVEDACGNISLAFSQHIEIQDTTPPIIAEQLADSLLTGTDCEFVVPDFAETVLAQVMDACTVNNDLVITQLPLAGSTISDDTEVTVSIEDECGNIATTHINAMMPEPLSVAILHNDTAFCEGGSVTLMASANGGRPDYSYTWTPTDGLDLSDESTTTATPSAGDYHYVVTVYDANGCSADAQVNVMVYATPDAPIAETTPNTICVGTPNGTITITAPVGEGYTYSLNGGAYQTAPTFTELASGDYTLMAQSQYGCISEAATVHVGVSQDMPEVTIVAPDEILCPNIGSQNVSAEITGGEAPFNYTWTGVTTSEDETASIDIAANNCNTTYIFSVSITDANNCSSSASDTLTVRDDELPTISGSLDTIAYNGCVLADAPAAWTTPGDLQSAGLTIADNCTDPMDLQLNVREVVSGNCPIVIDRYYTLTDACGNVSEEYLQRLQVFDSVAPAVTVSEVANEVDGCSAADAPSVATTPAALQALGFAFADACTNTADLVVNVTADTAGTCPTVITRVYTVTDACGNVSEEMTHIINIDDNENPAISGTIAVLTIDGCDATALAAYPIATSADELLALGGITLVDNCTPTAALTVQSSEEIAGECPIVVTRTYTVTDGCGNVSNEITQVINIQDTTNPVFTAEIPEQNLTSGNGHFVIPDLTALILANISDNCTDVDEIAISQTPEAGTAATQSTTVTVTITDNCDNSSSTEVSVIVPPALTITILQGDTSFCLGGSDYLTPIVEGGTPDYQFEWSPADGLDATDSQNVTATPDAGTHIYYVSVTDANGCTASDSIIIHVDTIPAVPDLTVVDNTVCVGDPNGSITIDSPVGEGYTYSLNGGEFQADPHYVGLAAGDYTIVVMTVAGCSASADAAIIDAFVVPQIDIVATDIQLCPNQGSVVVSSNVTDGMRPFTYTWSGEGVEDANSETTTLYIDETQCNRMYIFSVSMTDAFGCITEDTDTVYVFDDQIPTIEGTLPTITYNGCVQTDAPAAVTTADDLVALGLTLTDNCTDPSELVVSSRDEATGSCPLVISRYYTVTDACGNVSEEFLQTLQVFDSVAPVINGTIADVTTDGCDLTALSAFPTATTPAELLALGSISIDESCTAENELTVQSLQTEAGTCPIVVTRTYTVTDACGNISNEVTQVINIQDTTRPSFNGQVEEQLLTSTNCEFVVPDLTELVRALSADNCTSAANLTITQNPLANEVVTENGTVDVTVEDECGNTSVMTISLRLPEEMTATITPSTTTYCEWDIVTLTASATGGDTNYTYAWTPAIGLNSTTSASVEVSTEELNYAYSVVVTDGNGCTATFDYTLPEPSHLQVTTAEQASVTCSGFSNGAVVATAADGIENYTYLWDNGVTTALNENIPAGTYTVTVTDAYNCTATSTITITEPVVLALTEVSVTMPLCNQGTNGSAVVNVTGGTLPYTLSVNNVETATMAAEGEHTLSDLSAGNYVVDVVDINGCTAQINITVSEPDALLLTNAGTVNVSCNGLSDATATVSFSGGTAPYTLWIDQNEQITNVNTVQNVTFTDLAAGTYTITIEDANGCLTTLQVTITEPEVLTMTADNLVDVLCFGDANGSATVAPMGGTAPYQVTINNFTTIQNVPGGQTYTFTNLTANTYNAQVRDANGCEFAVEFTINTPTELTMTESSATDPLCFEGNDGQIVVEVDGGTAPYSLTVNAQPQGVNLQAGEHTISNLAAGTYVMEVTDANGCTAMVTTTLNEPDLLALTEVASTPITCFGGADGTSTIAVSGGTAPYSIWVDANLQQQTLNTMTETATFTDMNDGAHMVSISDAHGCTATLTISFQEPDEISAVLDSTTNVLCFGQENGTATFTISGGTLPYVVSVDASIADITLNTEDPYTVTGLWAGTYNVSVLDDHGCTTTMQIEITQPDTLEANASVLNNVFCFGNADGNATVDVNGGTVPYTYHWSNETYEGDLSDVSAGDYTITVTDANGCSAGDSATITEPELLQVILDTITESCNGESTAIIEVHAVGGTPDYNFLWSNGATTENLTDLAVGSYSVVLTDANGCEATGEYEVPFHALPDFTVATTDAFCDRDDGTAQIVGENQNLYSYSWTSENNPNAPVNNQLYPGDYVVTVDDGVCTLDLPFSIGNIPGPTAGFHLEPDYFIQGTAATRIWDDAIGSIVSWQYDFGDGYTSELQTPIYMYPTEGTYWVTQTVTDEHNCTDTAMREVTVLPAVNVYVPNAFTPNDDGMNDVWMPIISNCLVGEGDYELLVYSRWGQLIFRSTNPNTGWDGQSNGKPVEMAVYTYRLSYKNLLGKEEVKTGTVTVVR